MFANQASYQFLKTLDGLQYGALELVTPDGKTRVFEGKKPGAKAKLHLHDWRVVTNLVSKGDIGFAEDYRQGYWDTTNLQNVLALGLQNDQAIRKYVFGSQFFQTVSRLSYLLKLNTIQGSKKNIHAHYDLGNDFYELWLDPSMTYSSALYKNENDTLYTAQQNKYSRLLDTLNLDMGSILEIGCGWGGFAEHAAHKGDFEFKGITISEEQCKYAQDRLGKNANIALEDYRHQTGKYDGIVSIEMFEAVGERYWQTYFKKIASLLKESGKATIQTITIEDKRFERYRRGGDVIRSYIFPGGMLPSPSKFRQEAEKAGLLITDEFHFGKDYAKTLEEWLVKFDAQRSYIKTLGFDDSFIRLWRFYLAACIAGFSTGRTSVMHAEMVHAK
jgi:cyclopropane-fatty-acyl-phospholipid synthase